MCEHEARPAESGERAERRAARRSDRRLSPAAWWPVLKPSIAGEEKHESADAVVAYWLQLNARSRREIESRSRAGRRRPIQGLGGRRRQATALG